MTEAEFHRCPDPQALLEFLRGAGRASERKLRLFACACCRQDRDLLSNPSNRAAVELSERYADGLVGRKELKAARRAAWEALPSSDRMAAWEAAGGRAAEAAAATLWRLLPWRGHAHPVELLRDIFGPLPFRPIPLAPSVRAWKDGCVVKLAAAAYQERKLPLGTLDSGRLAVLADALEEAGLDDQEVLHHLREQGGVHVLGCWVVDALLGKG